jgi:predicted TIM-barrel fold metal-dependent hydrolase
MIDGHVHVWAFDPDRYPWQPTLRHVPVPTESATAEDLLGEMERAGVDGAVLVQPSVYGWDNSYLCDVLERHPGRFAGICLVDPHAGSAPADLRYWCAERGCRGLRLNLVAVPGDASWILGDVQGRILEVAAELAVPVQLQLVPAQTDAVCELTRRFETVTFVADYLGLDAFHDGTGITAAERLAAQPNTVFKLLSVSQDSHDAFPWNDLLPLYERAFAAFGPQRVIFGTDFPYVRVRSSYGESVRWVDTLSFLSPATREAVVDGNAREVFGLTKTRTELR